MNQLITGPGWFLANPGAYFLLSVFPGGEFELDGGHSDIEGVVRAKKLIQRIFAGRDNGEKFYAIQVLEIPDLDPAINEEAAGICAALVAPQEKGDRP